jgi:hypothetical protein
MSRFNITSILTHSMRTRWAATGKRVSLLTMPTKVGFLQLLVAWDGRGSFADFLSNANVAQQTFSGSTLRSHNSPTGDILQFYKYWSSRAESTIDLPLPPRAAANKLDEQLYYESFCVGWHSLMFSVTVLDQTAKMAYFRKHRPSDPHSLNDMLICAEKLFEARHRELN